MRKETLHLSIKKDKSDKGQLLITKKKDWIDTSNFDKEVNYVLMTNIESSSEAYDIKLSHSTLAFDDDNIRELRLFLRTYMLVIEIRL